MFDNIIKGICCKKEANKKKSDKAVCLIKVDGIGDSVIFLKVFNSLYNYYNALGYKIDLICAKPCGELYESQWKFNNLYEINIRDLYNYKYRTMLAKQILQQEYSIVLNCAYSRTISIDSLISIMNGKKKIGNQGDCGNTPGLIKWFTDKAYDELAPSSKDISEHNHNVDFLKWIGINDFQYKKEKKSSAVVDNHRYFTLFPGASNTNKCWAAEKFAAVAEVVYRKTNWNIVICGGKDDALMAERITQELADKNIQTQNKVGMTDILETCMIVGKSALVITNDTSGVHIANLYGISNICIAKGCDVGRFIDARDEHNRLIYPNHRAIYHKKSCSQLYKTKCLRKKKTLPCIMEITVDEVLNVVENLLDDSKFNN
ncbi:glycosyltransferase family 9 protein [Aminipila terrae]|uniref:Glycosyltransferase family 9 protein n=1 Tax=Aminipila terrae TaxID=2697030 RepID=A0A6P1MBK6_9FIRM|nr:glycosyltransferase family 9 protein [Aminipila terrae]QHI72089.1 hypothetical protein Ami3637_06460 [Aminipila terrae]